MQNSNNPNFNDIGKQIVSSLANGLSTGDYADLKSAIKQTASDAIREATGIPRYSGDVVDETLREKSQGHFQTARDVTGNHTTGGRNGADGAPGNRGGRGGRGANGAYGTPGPQGYVNPQGTPEASQRYASQLEAERRNREANKRAQEQIDRQNAEQRAAQRAAQRAQKSMIKIEHLPTKFVPIGNTSGVLCIVFGGIGLCIFAIWTLGSGIGFLIGELGVTIKDFLIPAVFAIASAVTLKIGLDQRRMLSRAKRYVHICGENMYSTIPELASSLGVKVSKVKKDIKKMLQAGFFPEGYIDEEETTLMLSSEVYKQYRKTKEYSISSTAASVAEDVKSKSSKEREIQLSEKAVKAREQLTEAERKELDDMVSEGLDCIDKLHKLNDDIPGESISAKMDELESTLKDIFVRVEEHPDQMKRMHRLMDYYLPTMLKLVEAYKEYDEIPNPAENIVSAKADIESTLDTINDAFKELLNRLFKDSVLDVTTDAQVLQTVLKEDGLATDTAKNP